MTIKWNDPTLNIDWKIKEPILSDRDNNAVDLDIFLTKYNDPFKKNISS
jgi:hypothetical protein